MSPVGLKSLIVYNQLMNSDQSQKLNSYQKPIYWKLRKKGKFDQGRQIEKLLKQQKVEFFLIFESYSVLSSA